MVQPNARRSGTGYAVRALHKNGQVAYAHGQGTWVTVKDAFCHATRHEAEALGRRLLARLDDATNYETVELQDGKPLDGSAKMISTEEDQGDDLHSLAQAMIALGEKRLADVLRKLEGEALKGLKTLVHPQTGERLQVKGMEYDPEHRHEEGNLTPR